MRRFIVAACVCWLAICDAERSNIRPLAFGMTPDEVSAVLGAPLVYVSGPRGSEVLLFEKRARTPGIYPVGDRIFLQFRQGRLTGWKRDWGIPRGTVW
jgi:hypothetical protein